MDGQRQRFLMFEASTDGSVHLELPLILMWQIAATVVVVVVLIIMACHLL